MATYFDGDVVIRGALTANTQTIATGAIADAQVAAGAAIQASKVIHSHRPFFQQASATTASTTTVPFYTVIGATGTVVSIKAGSVAIAVGAATVTVDVKKNGTSILTSVLTLNSSNVARVPASATIATAAAVAGDLYELVITATAGGGTLPTGLFVSMDIWESPT